jgi:thymidylate synthase
MQRCESAHTCWRDLVARVLESGERVGGVIEVTSVGSAFGRYRRSTLELIAATTSIQDPRARVVTSSSRRPRSSFAIANALWVLSCSNELSLIEPFNKKGREFSEDGETLRAALGSRIFHSKAGDQFASVIQRLKTDPTSRRAVMQIAIPDEFVESWRDTSCVGSLQFIVRDEKVMLLCQMRSQSALMVWPYDAFVITMLHEAVALNLGRALGRSVFTFSSLHVYEDEIEGARALLAEDIDPIPLPMPAMPDYSPTIRAALRRVLRSASAVEAGDANTFVEQLSEPDLGPYWLDLIRTMIARR